MQSGAAGVVRKVDVRSAVEEETGHADVAAVGGEVDRRITEKSDGVYHVDVGAVVEEEGDSVDVALADGEE